MAGEDRVDQATDVTTTSWLSRLGQAIVGVLVGIVVVIGSGVLLFWNEGHAIKTAQGLTEGAGIVRSVSADRVDPGNDQRLIHVSGMLTAGGPVGDGDFALRIQSLRLLRHVEMYQWQEETHTETRTERNVRRPTSMSEAGPTSPSTRPAFARYVAIPIP